MHLQQLPTSRPLAAPIAGSATVTPSLPDFYGTHSSPVVLAGGVVVRLVDRADSNVPLALILTDPKDDPARWAGVQSSLEQFAVGSLAISAGAGTPALAEAATTLERLARRRSQPLAVIAAGGAIETALALAADSPLADRALVLLAPPAPQHPLLARLAEHAPGWLRRRLLDADDRRLSSWRGRVLVVRAHDDGTLDAVAANALVAGSHGGDVLVVPGDGFTRGPLHPDPEGWRAIADFVRGVVRKREEITVWPDSFPGESADSGR
ncbi:MAG: hypothetical protein ABJC19_11190 [Gemmatimonadota bacterium]